MKIAFLLFFILSLGVSLPSISNELPSNKKDEWNLSDPSSLNSPQDKTISQVFLISPFQSVTPGQTIPIGILFHLQHGWHTYWSYAGETGKSMSVHFRFPDLSPAESPPIFSLHWPTPERHTYQMNADKAIYSFVYEEEVLIPYQLKIPDQIKQETIKIEAEVEWLACKDVCISFKKQVSLNLPIQYSPVISKEKEQLFQKWKQRSPEEKTTIKSWFQKNNSKK